MSDEDNGYILKQGTLYCFENPKPTSGRTPSLTRGLSSWLSKDTYCDLTHDTCRPRPCHFGCCPPSPRSSHVPTCFRFRLVNIERDDLKRAWREWVSRTTEDVVRCLPENGYPPSSLFGFFLHDDWASVGRWYGWMHSGFRYHYDPSWICSLPGRSRMVDVGEWILS